MSGITSLIYDIVNYFAQMVYDLFYYIFVSDSGFGFFEDTTFNIYLFSETGWFSEPLYLEQVFTLVMSIFMFIFLLRLLWKVTKKFITMVFGVFRV